MTSKGYGEAYWLEMALKKYLNKFMNSKSLNAYFAKIAKLILRPEEHITIR